MSKPLEKPEPVFTGSSCMALAKVALFGMCSIGLGVFVGTSIDEWAAASVLFMFGAVWFAVGGFIVWTRYRRVRDYRQAVSFRERETHDSEVA